MPKLPLIVMEILCNQLLCWWLLCVILQQGETSQNISHNSISISKSSTHQWRKDLLSSAPRNRKPSVCASITSRQRLAEVIARLLARDSQLNRYKRILLLLLKINNSSKNHCIVTKYWNHLVCYLCQWLKYHLSIHLIRLQVCLKNIKTKKDP